MKPLIFWMAGFFCFSLLHGSDTVPTILVMNHIDSDLIDFDSSLSTDFTSGNFKFNSPGDAFFSPIDSLENPASGRMELIRSLGNEFNADYIMFNQIIEDSARFLLEGQMYSTRSGGMVRRRKLDVTSYYKGQLNEIRLWVGEILNAVSKDWVEYREMILFQDPETIVYDKTPMGAMVRSLAVPGWGQVYSGENTSALLWGGLESSLAVTILAFFSKYDKARKAFIDNTKLYEASSEQYEFDMYRTMAEAEWQNHIDYNNYMIYTAAAAGTLWIVNSIHAYIVGPRPKKDIIQKWDVFPPEKFQEE